MKFIKKTFSKKEIAKTTTSPGVYIYWSSKSDQPIYVGKAKNLKNRLKSYAAVSLFGKTKKMISETDYFSYIVVNSEIEALILEAKLVRKFMPFYNIELKDDKHPLYVVITNDEFPRVLTVRKNDVLHTGKIYGPFPSSTLLKMALKTLRKSLRFSDHLPSKSPCLYSQINLCNPCPSSIVKMSNEDKIFYKKEYIKNISILKKILDGNFQKVFENLEKEINVASKSKNFEEAIRVRDKLVSLKYITQNNNQPSDYIENPNFISDLRNNETKLLQKILEVKGDIKIEKLNRIECYDIAHLSGNFTTASMVTFLNGEPDKNYYRHFRIKSSKKSSDVDSLSEVIERRIKHLSDWGVPDLIIVDGGKGQVKRFHDILSNCGIYVVGLAKREESLVFISNGKFSIYKLPNNPAKNLLQRMRDEAHRFARRYHHQLLRNSLLPNK